jgi:hypothetical protein
MGSAPFPTQGAKQDQSATKFFVWLALLGRCWTSDRLQRHHLRNSGPASSPARLQLLKGGLVPAAATKGKRSILTATIIFSDFQCAVENINIFGGFEFMYNFFVIFFLLLHANDTYSLHSYPFSVHQSYQYP